MGDSDPCVVPEEEPTMAADYGRQVPSVARAVRLLEAVGTSTTGVTAGELEEVVGGSRSSLYALLNTLDNHEWLVRDDAGRATIGPALRALVPAEPSSDALREAFTTCVRGVAPNESTILVAGHAQHHVVAVHHPARAVVCGWQVGDARHDGAEAAMLQSGPDGIRPHDPVIVRGDPDLVEIAAPVCRDGHTPIAAIVIGIPRQRADGHTISSHADEARQLAADVSRRLGAPAWRPWGGAEGDTIASRTLTDAEVDEVLAGPATAQLACLRPDGTPHVVPLWFEWVDGHLLLAASPGSSWLDYLDDNAAVAVTIEASWPRLHRVLVTGSAAPVEDLPGGVTALHDRLARRNLGTGLSELAVSGHHVSHGDDGDWQAVRVVPDRIVGHTGVVPRAEPTA